MTDHPLLLDLRDVRAAYGDREVLHGVDLRVAPGETVALLGPNGAGKSTAVSVLLGLARPTGGTATVCGRPPTAPHLTADAPLREVPGRCRPGSAPAGGACCR